MLRIIANPSELDYGQVMQVYNQSLQKSGESDYPHLDPNQQLLEAEQDFFYFLKAFLYQKQSICAVWIEQGRYVSALRAEPYQDGFLIEGLETMPNCRQKGYASHLLLAASKYLFENYTDIIYSHIHKKNRISINTHLSCGFSYFQDYAVFIDGSVDYQNATYKMESHRS